MFQIGPITLDFTSLLNAMAVSPFYGMLYFIAHGGWIILLFVTGQGFFHMYMNHIQGGYVSKWQHVLLAIDVPKDNEQSPKAVELMFAHLAGAHNTPNFTEKYWEGKVQEPFSFEIASHEGVVRFYVRTTAQMRDLTEAAIFAQYPDAQITEVEDYTSTVPDDWPNPEWKVWAAELPLYNDQSFPIRTYPAFEHMLSGEFKDPMAALLEFMSKMGPGEHAWMQLIIIPTDDSWKAQALALAKKLAGQKVAKKQSAMDQVIGLPSDIMMQAAPTFFGTNPAEAKKEEKFSLFQLLPGEQKQVEAIQYKAAKIGFLTKFRLLYAGEKSVFHKGRGVSSFFGAIKQFNTHDMNGFKPDKRMITKANYIWVKQREGAKARKLVRWYKMRSAWSGISPYILNIEELASLWHFPVIGVRAPMLAKTEAKRREPPASLPTQSGFRLRPVAPYNDSRGKPPESEPEYEPESEPGADAPPGMQPASEAMGASSYAPQGDWREDAKDTAMERSSAPSTDNTKAEPPPNLPTG